MSGCSFARSRFLILALAGILAAGILAACTAVRAGGFCGGGFRNNAVGGVSIDAHGVVAKTTAEDARTWLKLIKGYTTKAPESLTAPVALRKVSLRRLEQAIGKARKDGHGILPEEIAYLAGLQRIEYVLVYPDEHDIVLAGPGEGWTVNDRGDVVGVTTGRPVMLLDDLLVALRTVETGRSEGITVSIDPTEEGRKALGAYLRKVKTFSPAAVAGMEKALGPQQITVTGVPDDSHFARVMVVADFHMKRIGMGLDPTPVKEVPSFPQILVRRRLKPTNMTPRWWLACNYEPIGRSEDGLAWHLRGPGVKAMTEEEFSVAGKLTGSGKASPAAQEWADNMTEHYGKLCAQQPSFAELRNIMDLSVLAALIEKEDLLAAAGLELPALLGKEPGMNVETWHAPKTIATQCSFTRSGSDYIITASGGVEIDAWGVASRNQAEAQAGQVRQTAAAKGADGWWWN